MRRHGMLFRRGTRLCLGGKGVNSRRSSGLMRWRHGVLHRGYAAAAFNADTINPLVRKAEYAVRGTMVLRAEAHDAALKSGQAHELPFDQIVYCNIGNPQALGQQPITFNRQVLAMLEHPDLINHTLAPQLFPQDAIARAKRYLEATPAGVGAYTHSQGMGLVREEVAAFIGERDGHATDASTIFLTDGASPGVQNLMRISIRDEKDGIMIPIPQYPLYSATIPLNGGSQVEYFLDESSGWGMTVEELSRSYDAAVAKGIQPRGLVVINPGNPTGQCLALENQESIVRFCDERELVLLADEVYQENVYAAGKEFISFRKVVKDLQSQVPVVSFHSVSKGVLGECGHRGGYFQLTNVSSDVHEQLYKLASINLCPNTIGQYMVGLMVNPPRSGEPSYELYHKETQGIFNSLKRRAERVVTALSGMDGITCNEVEGALYAFPSIELPAAAIAAAKEAGQAPDLFYSMKLLDATGICVVPGSGFGQRDGTFHFRTTILPAEDVIADVMQRMAKFHAAFMAQYK